jgi:uncharacterized protein YqeY
VETIRFLLAAIKNYEIDKYPPSVGGTMTDDDVLSVILKQVKTHKESIDCFMKAKRDDLVERETKQLEILSGYLPKQLSREEIKQVINKLIVQMKNEGQEVTFGRLMGEAMKTLKSKADTREVSDLIRGALG